ncbi:hypothetical protein [Sediminibacillus halophilus]|uniref:Glycerophosphoryl diester phosphodiesterase n=1 Tax=Sediminibacillus halophilus TaxID=482461 RepID=A0A1G9RNP8_9BACI|nr:hypothetical protein [Sediminibacillus halophilus]SDM24597.1 glycerophosphoryl diester phosphodiesterase [Sediminibacillus halophilus]
MGIHVIESFLQGKRPDPELCEDMLVINEDFTAVIDGATNVSGKKINGKSPGRIAGEIVKQTVERMDKKVTLEGMIEQINQSMQSFYQKQELLEEISRVKWLAPSACMAIYSNYHREVWQIGDCQAIIEGKLYKNEKQLDTITANARSLYLEAELKKGKAVEDLLVHDTGWEFIQPLILQQYYLQNDPKNQYGYEVINGFPVDQNMVQVTPVPAGKTEVILASDGYPFLRNNLSESEVALEKLLREDPLCFRAYKASKGMAKGNESFDDRAYIRIRT